MRTIIACSIPISLILVACDGGAFSAADGPDGGGSATVLHGIPSSDGANAGQDADPPVQNDDGASPGHDAGNELDSVAPPTDSGTPPVMEASVPEAAPVADSGTPPTDSGTVVPEACTVVGGWGNTVCGNTDNTFCTGTAPTGNICPCLCFVDPVTGVATAMGNAYFGWTGDAGFTCIDEANLPAPHGNVMSCHGG